MINIEFDYNQEKILIQAKSNDIFRDVINKYLQKTLLNPNNTYFFANEKQINQSGTIESHMSNTNKESNEIKILVQLIEDEEGKKNIFDKSIEIICPSCKEPCLISIENYKIKLFGCINNHITNNIKIKDFPDTQKINISNIICNKCKINNKGNSTKNDFYKCLNCNQNLCLLCRANHNINHNIIKYDLKNYICQKHNEPFIKYCKECNKNYCFSCEEEHDEHETISLSKLRPNIDEVKNNLIKMKKEIDLFNNKVKQIIKKLNELINIMNIYYEINNNVLNSYNKQNRNFQIFKNIKNININNEFFQELIKINNIKNFDEQSFNIIELSNKINSNNDDNNIKDDTDEIIQIQNIKNKPELTQLIPIFQEGLKKIKLNKKESAILLLGLDNSGKTTLLFLLIGENNENSRPTPGCNGKSCQISDNTIYLYDLGGLKAIREYWKYYYDNVDALIYVIDIIDEKRFDESRECLQNTLKDEKLNNLPLLIFCNKCDLKNSKIQFDIIKKKFNFIENSGRLFKFGLGSGLKGINIKENMLWIGKQIFGK